MNDKIYLDNNATTMVDEEVYNEILPYLKNEYGNPGSIYSFGKVVRNKIDEAREKVARMLNAKPEEIIFVSGASEANTMAIMSAVKNNPTKHHIITTKVEHSSVMENMKYLESIGYKVTYLSVDEKGRLDIEELKSAITDDTCLIAIMMANNEIGNIYPIKEMAKIASENNILFHCDAVQAIGKMKVDVKELGVDTLSLAGHKIHAPKGIGALYVKNSVDIKPLIFGHQEYNKRGGTENVPGIVALGKACELIVIDNFETDKKIRELRDYMEEQIKLNIEDVFIYGDIENRIINTSSVAFKGVKGDELLILLESFNIFVSTGSACDSQTAIASHVLRACKADLDNYSPIRIGLSKYTSKDEIDIFVKRLISIIKMIRRRK